MSLNLRKLRMARERLSVSTRVASALLASTAIAGCPTPKPVLPAGADTTAGTTTAASSSGSIDPDDDTTLTTLTTPTGPDPSDSSAGSTEDTGASSSTTGDPVCELGPRCTPVVDPGWMRGWAWRRRIDVASPLVVPLVDAVVPVRLDEGFEYACASPDGADLRFVDEGGAALAHELDEWQPGLGAVAWVHLPTLDPAGASLWLYYGNPAATASAGEVWPDAQGYQAVLHFGGDLDDARGMHHAEPHSKDVAPLYVSDGVLGQAVHYEPILVDARAELLGSDLIDDAIIDSEALTVTAWVRSTPDVVSDSQFRGVVGRGSDLWGMAIYDDAGAYDFLSPSPALFNTDCIDVACVGVLVSPPEYNHFVIGTTPVIENDVVAYWHHVAMVYAPLGGGMYQKRLYVDGALDVASDPLALPMPWTLMGQHLDPVTIGTGPQNSSSVMYYGEIDEVHLASAAWTADRIEAEFALADQPERVTVGSAECR